MMRLINRKGVRMGNALDRDGYDSPQYKAFRYAVLSRDLWQCQLTGRKGGELEVHHIIPWAQAPHLRYAISNGITLSKEAHELVTGREADFQEQFQRIVAAKQAAITKGARKIKSTKGKWRPQNPHLRY